MLNKLFGSSKSKDSRLRAISVPIDAISAIVEAAIGKVQQIEHGISFATGIGQTRIEVIPVHHETSHGHEIEAVIKIRTELLHEFEAVIKARNEPVSQSSPMDDEEKLSLFNALASFGALLRDPDTGRLVVASRLSAFAGDSASWRLYVPLVAFGSMLQGESIIKGIAKFLDYIEAAPMVLPDSEKPCFWGRQDFEGSERLLDQQGFIANGDAGGMTVEFPWEQGALSSIVGHSTSLVQFFSDQPHPILGNGLFFKLDLPVQFEPERLTRTANLLNLWEWKTVDAPPFFGAWCNDKKSGLLSHVGFWPNAMYQSGTVTNIAIWMMHRTRLVKEVL